MTLFRVQISETRFYDFKVAAEDENEATDIAYVKVMANEIEELDSSVNYIEVEKG